MFDMYQTEDVWQSVVFVRLIDPRTKRVLARAMNTSMSAPGANPVTASYTYYFTGSVRLVA